MSDQKSATRPPIARSSIPKVVIVGAGFAGLKCAQGLRNANVEITVVDRKNHHTFQPLLYQVAMAVLSPAEIASPVRHILKDANVLMDEVVNFDLEKRKVYLKNATLDYDYLVIASGATHSYFGHDEWSNLAPGLKTLEDAVEIRRRVLLAFELAERQCAEQGIAPPINFVVVGGGPTGVELAGAISDIARMYMKNDFRKIDPSQARILLLEGGPRVLPAFFEELSDIAKRQLEDLGVEVRTNAIVTDIQPGYVRVGQEVIPSTVTLWAAGVAASPLGKALGAPTDRSGRVFVDENMNVPGHPEVFVVGDLAHFTQNGAPVPGVAPAAIQMGKAVAKYIVGDQRQQRREPFHYVDKGTLATIGRKKGIAQIGNSHFSGILAWMAWLGIHIFFLIGFRNRFLVLAEWAWVYFTFTDNARLITGDQTLPGWHTQPPDGSSDSNRVKEQKAKPPEIEISETREVVSGKESQSTATQGKEAPLTR